MNKSRKRMSIKDFRRLGYLQEANRLFFHRIGLDLEVITNQETGEEKLLAVWDYRDSGGVIFTEYDQEKAKEVFLEIEQRKASRAEMLECDDNGIQITNLGANWTGKQSK